MEVIPRLNAEASPFKTVLDNAQDETKLSTIPKTAIPTTAAAEANPAK